jgi:hypothetical protein
MKKVEIDVKIGNSQIKGEFDRDFAKMMIEKMLENNNGKIEIPEKKAVAENKQVFYRRKSRQGVWYNGFKEAVKDKDYISTNDLAMSLGNSSRKSFGGHKYSSLNKIAKSLGFEKVWGGYKRKSADIKKIPFLRKKKFNYKKVFKEVSAGKDSINMMELVKAIGCEKLADLGGKRYKDFEKIAKRQGYVKVFGGFEKVEKATSVTVPSVPEPKKRSPSVVREITLSKAQIESVIFTIGRSIKTFTVSDVMKAMNLNPPNTSNPEYLRVYWVLGGMSNRGIVTKTCYIVNDGKKTFYSIPSKAEKKEDEKEKLVLPPDTTDDILKKIIDNYTSFNWEALMQVKNKHSNNYQKYSAKALFDWMCRNTEYLMNITGKKISTGGSGDFRFIQVLG